MKPILVSFSGGRTSAFMARYLQLKHEKDGTPLHYVFANTGKERPETLDFVNECDRRWGLGVVWVEADVIHEEGVGTGFTVVTYETASRNGEPFEEAIKKYGIPNQPAPICTRELKQRPIGKYMKSLGYESWLTAIGIRADEMHRINRKDQAKKGFIYPLADESLMNSELIRIWWDRQDFNLALKDYEGNCDMCWKKSKRKLLTMITEMPDMIEWWNDMEIKYGNGLHFYRGDTSAKQLVKQAQRPFVKAIDMHELTKRQGVLFDAEMDSEMDCFCKSS
jgi:hypothetical protein